MDDDKPQEEELEIESDSFIDDDDDDNYSDSDDDSKVIKSVLVYIPHCLCFYAYILWIHIHKLFLYISTYLQMETHTLNMLSTYNNTRHRRMCMCIISK